jgi:hypothetical protein
MQLICTNQGGILTGSRNINYNWLSVSIQLYNPKKMFNAKARRCRERPQRKPFQQARIATLCASLGFS